MAKLVWAGLILFSAVVATGVAFTTGEHGGQEYKFLKTEPKKYVRTIPFKPPEPDPLSKETSAPVPRTHTADIPASTEPYYPAIALPPPAIPERVFPHFRHIIIGRTHHEKKNICEVHHGVKIVTGKTWHCEFHR